MIGRKEIVWMRRACPKCDSLISSLVTVPWGDGKQTTRIAPYICGSCASLLLIDLVDLTLIDPEVLLREAGIDVVAMMQKNKPFWDSAERARRKIMATPDLKPVVR